MIISEDVMKFDGSYRMLRYNTDKKGKLSHQMEIPPIAGKEKLADALYLRKAAESKRMKDEILKGNYSPIRLMIELQYMDIKDLASRMRLSTGVVKKHLTIEGFKKINVETLQRYAKVFNVSVADFFCFINIKKNTHAEVKDYIDRIFQDINITIKKK